MECRTFVSCVLAVFLLAGCSVKRVSRALVPPDQVSSLDRKSPFLKAHMRDGRVLVLSQWRADSAAHTVSGRGEALDVNRGVVARGDFTVPLDSVDRQAGPWTSNGRTGPSR